MPRLRSALTAGLLGAVMIVSGCSSDSSSDSGQPVPEGTTYTSTQYGFEFTYQAPFEEQKDTEWEAESGASTDSVAVFDTTGSRVDGQFRDAFVVNVYQLGQEIVAGDLPAVQKELESSVLPSLESSNEQMQIGDLTETEVAGLPGFTAAATFSVSDTPMTTTMYFLFNGDLEYQILEQATAENWDALQPDFQRMLDSFTVIDSARSASPSAAS